jgi:hypothetical protein
VTTKTEIPALVRPDPPPKRVHTVSVHNRPGGRYTSRMHKDAGIIFLGLAVAIVFGALLMNYSKGSPSSMPQPAAVSFSLLSEGENAQGITERTNYRIRTEEELGLLWKAIHEDDEMPVPYVDFEAHDVLAVFEGERPSSGYDISVVSVENASDGTLKVTVLHEEPGNTCITTAVITSPFELVVVPKSDAKITREDLVNVKECE